MLNDSSTVVLGAHMNFSGPVVTPATEIMTDLVKEINGILLETLGTSEKWSTLIVEVNTVLPNEQVRRLGYATGKSFSFSHGSHEGYASVDDQSVTPGTILQHGAGERFVLPVF